jgi:hypothetical protein
MEVDIEQVVTDQHIKKVLYALDEIQKGGNRKIVLDRMRSLLDMQKEEDSPTPHEVIRFPLEDYAAETLDIYALKNKIFETLDECGMLNRVV